MAEDSGLQKTSDTAKREAPAQKSATAAREEEVLAFWKENQIFEKSLKKAAPKGEFVFYDGPPFATGLPHTGSLLSSVVKDVIPRYMTMRGYHVRRRWGWDCHGLPIESLIEKRLNLKTKKDIEKVGVDVFNEAARSSVLEFEHEWERYIERVGRWVDFKKSYKTMDNSYIESVWWALKKLYEKGRLYEGKKVLMYCTHCETPLAKAEIAMDNTYKDTTEEAVTIKFKIRNPEKFNLPGNSYILAWTTTPWTLPGNVALAVGSDIKYTLVEIAVPEKKEYLLVAADPDLQERIFRDVPADNVEFPKDMILGKDLVGIEYEPLYEIPALQSETSYKVYAAEFVNTEEGTGIVHTAVMYGEDDFALGQKIGLPMVQLLDASGNYNELLPEFLRGKYIKDAERDIKRDLENRGLLFARKNHTHSYPHCYRCGTPLIYNAVSSWFIDIQSVKQKMLSENEKINWIPDHLKHGRFENIVESAPDWTISRNRFWASPLPIWKEKGGKRVMVIGSLEELRAKAKHTGNRYFLMRHGEADSNVRGIVSSESTLDIHLTKKGVESAKKSLSQLGDVSIDIIYSSPFHRTIETAALAAERFNIAKDDIVLDDRLAENSFGILEGKTREEYQASFPEKFEHFFRGPEGGETFTDVRRRVGQFLRDTAQKHRGKNILIVSHGTPLWLLDAAARGASKEEAIQMRQTAYPDPGEIKEVDFRALPLNRDFELDLHRPYTDGIVLVDEAGREYERIPEVVDCWVESASMPFAEYHYPFENKKEFEVRFPGDFIAEYIAQTRTWFYYMHALGVQLFNSLAFKNVVSTGTILAADGSKMSKSKGNYTDPLVLLDQYGADAFRFTLLGSVVMQSEDLNFRDEDVRDAHNRVVGILWNTYKFFELYKSEYDGKTAAHASSHVLDRWILKRLQDLIRTVRGRLDAFDTPSSCRAIRTFVEDYSTWYVRRSRDRMKIDTDKQYALATQQEVLCTLSRVIAPFMPFLAENIYRGAGGALESVHLESWPQERDGGFFSRFFARKESRILLDMDRTRRIVSSALEKRSAAKIRVRQPLSTLTVSSKDLSGDKEAYVRIIAEEVNVARVEISHDLPAGEVLLDATLTPELLEEGLVREFIRSVQAARRDAGLKPKDRALVRYKADLAAEQIIKKHALEIREATNTSALSVDETLKVDATARFAIFLGS